jgi:ABC-type transport system involved in multi-copper enzyme maturation permease subunit
MTEIVTIGLNTFREAIRNKILYIILLFAVLLIASSIFLSTLALDAAIPVIKNLGLSAINVFGLLVAMFIGVSLIPQEVESKTIYMIVSQGVARWQFVLGKFLGLLLTVYAMVALMSLLFFGVLLAMVGPHDDTYLWMLKAIFMQLFEMLIIVSVAILFSSFSTPILSAMLTLIVYIIGNMTNDFWDFIRLESEKVGAYAPNVLFYKFIWSLCPHLDMLNLKKVVVHFEELPASLTYFPYGVAISHAVVYAAVVLGLSCVAFSKRDF